MSWECWREIVHQRQVLGCLWLNWKGLGLLRHGSVTRATGGGVSDTNVPRVNAKQKRTDFCGGGSSWARRKQTTSTSASTGCSEEDVTMVVAENSAEN